MINLRREVIANSINDFNFTPQRDKVLRMRFLHDEEEGHATHLRIFMNVDGEDAYSDVKLAEGDHVATLERTSRYFDAPILSIPADQITPQMQAR